ncbi:hypothetical protein Hden_0425 [Hyphomicrobium denitrificans ATCC 51888]|uniref:Spore coat protein U domain-containing protein n=1 Tax=Hyphomicrobium denitrificans (strain ATCC 51888 / DSM 1869 / NCIMB 11706 / TK 0415) TaxID=582899 RepID=D8JRL8_HYPDA|nr:hypothetical protein [Hyphomicrobium denitrificans]ADJ22247.1 hypothetical protein Hden_0425 [Hyphomicrobium denitrificans ATCC 51888]
MMIRQYQTVLFLILLFGCSHAQPANALCAILTASATPLTANTGTFAPGSTPSAQPVVINVKGTFIAALGDLAGGCAAAISFNRSSLPASMLISGGGTATLPYQLRDSSSGGKSLLYTGSGIPSSANALTFTFPAALLSIDNFNVTVWAQAQPNVTQQAGSYLDNITIDVFTSTLAGILQGRVSAQGFTVTGTVLKSCTVGGVHTPAADTAVIPITASGNVNTAPINRSYSNAFCNSPANVQLTSDNGAVTTGGSGGGLQRLINYSASASFSGAAASLNTATSPGATGAESGPVSPTSGTSPTGSLGVTITPQINAQPLAAGNYSDTLRITITPQ